MSPHTDNKIRMSSNVYGLVAPYLSLAEAGHLSRISHASREAMTEWHGDNRELYDVPVMIERFFQSIRAQVEYAFNETFFNGLLPFRCEISQNHKGLPTLDVVVYFANRQRPVYVLRMEIESEDSWTRSSNEPRWWLRVKFRLPNKNAVLSLAFPGFNNYRGVVETMTAVTFKPTDPYDDRGDFLRHNGQITYFRQGYPPTQGHYANGIENEFLGLCGLLYGG